jgi:hypothetical protein
LRLARHSASSSWSSAGAMSTFTSWGVSPTAPTGKPTRPQRGTAWPSCSPPLLGEAADTARCCRDALGITGRPTPADAWRLLEFVQSTFRLGGVTVEIVKDCHGQPFRLGKGYHLHKAGPTLGLVLPNQREREDTEALPELIGAGTSAWLRPSPSELRPGSAATRLYDEANRLIGRTFAAEWLQEDPDVILEETPPV